MALGWLVYRMTHSELLLGTVGFSSQIMTFMVTPFAALVIATPVSGNQNNGGIGQIALTGIDWESPAIGFLWGTRAHLGGFYENRTGQGAWNGNYLGLHAAFSKGF